MENKKDLSKAFSIMFGIKPSEVPPKSSGVYFRDIEYIDKLNDQMREALTKNQNDFENFLKEMGFKITLLEDLTEYAKTTKSEKEVLKKQVEELERRSKIKGSKAQDCEWATNIESKYPPALEGADWKYERYPQTNNAINKSTLEEDSKNKVEVKGKPQDMYQVNFKDDRYSITITESMFINLMVNKDTTNLNGYRGMPNLLIGSDDETREMICLDSSSILSIVKCK